MLLCSNTIPLYLHVRQKYIFFHRKRSLDYTFVLLQFLIKYVYTKTNFYTEKYVKKYTCKRDRSLFAQLRVGILTLEIETR